MIDFWRRCGFRAPARIKMLRYVLLLISLGICYGHYNLNPSSLGRVFDGIGGISGGGATSKLLISYPEKERSEILDYLFKPNFGASLHILKVEIPGDAQTTDGTESSHMHESWDENYNRGYEWWIMKEAKKRNPDIKLVALPWAFPAWVGKGHNPFQYPNVTALYVVKWILGAKQHHGLDIDYVGIWNELSYSVNYVKALKSTLLSHKLDKVKIIVSDQEWQVTGDILSDPSFAKVVDVIGAHYPGTFTTDDALLTKKTLWSSEDYSTRNNDVGAGCQARILNENYLNGFMTSTIVWNLVASYYDHFAFGSSSLMTAYEPWSGHYEVKNPIWATAHTTQFTNVGWTYLKHGYGVQRLTGGGSFVTLVSPDGSDYTIIIETMKPENSKCVRPAPPKYKVITQEAEFFLHGAMANIEKFNVWKTDFKTKRIFEKEAPIMPSFSSFNITLEPDQIYTLTTLNSGMKGSYKASPMPKPFPKPFFDNYENYNENEEAHYFAPQNGVFEIVSESENSPNKVNRQVVLRQPIYWRYLGDTTITLGGDYNWKDVELNVHVKVPSVNRTTGVMLAARVDQGSCEVKDSNGIFFAAYPGNSSYAIYCNFPRNCILAEGKLGAHMKLDAWHKLGMTLKGSEVTVNFDGKFLAKATIPQSIKHGFVGYGTTTFGIADFDNFSIN